MFLYMVNQRKHKKPKHGYFVLFQRSSTVKPVLSGHLKGRPKLFFNTDYHLMQVKSIAECSMESILQFFWPSIRHHWSLRALFCLFLSSRFRQFYCMPIYVCFKILHHCSLEIVTLYSTSA